MRISCLHTNASEIPVFERACPKGMTLVHHVRSDLFYRAQQDLDAGVLAETAAHMKRIAAGSDAVLLTCSLLGSGNLPGYCADALLAEQCAKAARGKSLEVLYTCRPAFPTIKRYFGPLKGPRSVEITFIPAAWELLTSDRTDDHNVLVRDAVSKCKANFVAISQASMVAALDTKSPRLLTAPEAALQILSEKLAESTDAVAH